MTGTTSELLSEMSPVKRALFELREARAKLKAMKEARTEPIAVIGMGIRFPGDVNSADELWQLLLNGVDAVTEMPADRWDVNDYYEADTATPGKMSTRWGGFIKDVDKFDAHFFSIAPREAISMDPQHRLLLEVTWEALEAAGQAPDKLVGSATGVFVGISSSDYSQFLFNTDHTAIDTYLAQGFAHSTASGRVSYILGLEGPAVSLDTACSSSLTAVHLAVQSLRQGECRMALAGGVNVILTPEIHISFSKAHMMAADGRCKTFDARADGFVRSEGCGIVVLKRLSDAIADRDNILAVIKGSAINQDGRSNGLTAPNGLSQEAVIRAALANAGVETHQVAYIETHGTGTSLGDPIEVQALGAVFKEGRTANNRLKIGSLKTNLGHLEAAAGVASLMKTALVLKHKKIPPHLHLQVLNPYISWDEFPIDVPTETIPLPAVDGRYIAGLSSFGFSGTNVHLVLEAPPEPEPQAADVERPLNILKLSAKDEAALQKLVGRFNDYLADTPADFQDVCFTANTGRADLSHRLAIVAHSAADARSKLAAFAANEEHEDTFTGTVFNTASPELVFLFTGHGAQYINMGRQLYETQPTFRAALAECADILQSYLDRSLWDILYPGDEETGTGLLDQMTYAQPALFAVEYALAKLWLSWDVKPTTVLGHSIGEYVAACIAGVFNLADGLKLVAARGQLMDSLPQAGEMAAIFADEETVTKAIAPYANRVSIAVINGPTNIVISGESEVIEAVLSELAHRDIKSRRLAVAQAAHSHFLDPILDEFEAVAHTVTYSSPQLGLVSCLTGRMVAPHEITNAGYWRQHLRHPVRFAEGMRTLYEEDYQHFLEIGPHPTLSGMAQRIPGAEGRTFQSSLRKGWDDWQQMLESIGQLYVKGVNINWPAIDRDYSRRRLVMPTYPWSRQRYWLTDTSPRQAVRTSGQRPLWQALVKAGDYQAERGPLDLALDTHPRRWECLGRLSVAYIVRALRALGVFMQPGEKHSIDTLLSHCKIETSYADLLGRWLQKLAETGLLQEPEPGHFTSPEPLPEVSPESILQEARALFTDGPYLPDYIERCGQKLAAILTGHESPLETLFPAGSYETVEYLYHHSAQARYFNDIARTVVESVVNTLPQDRQLRILEVEARTGGTTAALVPVLPPERTVYYLTNTSEFLSARAGQQFKEYPFIRCGLMNVEQSPQAQGYGAHNFDVVVGANVFHTVQDLNQALEHALSLLAPGGLLLLLETVNLPPWFESSIGLVEGWRQFDDKWRQGNLLPSPEQWEKALQAFGFESVAVWPRPGSAAEVLDSRIIVAQAPLTESMEVILPADEQAANDTEADLTLSTPSSNGDKAELFLAQLKEASPDDRRELLIDFIRRHVIKVTRYDPSRPLDNRHRLMDLGVDSLMAVELRNRLGTGLGLQRPLTATLVFDYPTIEAIAGYLEKELFTSEAVIDEWEIPPAGSSVEEGAIIDVSDLETLSETEVEALLLKKLKDI